MYYVYDNKGEVSNSIQASEDSLGYPNITAGNLPPVKVSYNTQLLQ